MESIAVVFRERGSELEHDLAWRRTSPERSGFARGERSSDVKLRCGLSRTQAHPAWDVAGQETSSRGLQGEPWPWHDRLPGRPVVEGIWSEELEDIDELADYRTGVPEGTGKCSKGEELEGWPKGRKAMLPTRIPSTREAKSSAGFPEHTFLIRLYLEVWTVFKKRKFGVHSRGKGSGIF